MILDSLHVKSSILAFPDQCQQAIKDVSTLQLPHDFNEVRNIVISGMGGSALGGRILTSLERQISRVPILVSTDPHLPNFVDENTLVIISSYSGNTAETVNALHDALARNAKVFVMCAGGKLAQIAQEQNLPSYVFDPIHNVSSMPRLGLGYSCLGLLVLLSRLQLISPLENLSLLSGYLKKQLNPLDEQTQHLANGLHGHVAVLVSSGHLKGSTHACKNQLNENAKHFAAAFDLPELNHHLLEGLVYPQSNPTNLSFLFINSSHYPDAIKKLLSLSRKVVEKNHIPTHTLELNGPSQFFEAINLIQAGSLLAYHLSQKNQVDPGPIPWVDWYKDEMKKLSISF